MQEKFLQNRVSFQWETYPSIASEMRPMMRLYWETEGEIFGEELPMNPDFDSIMQLHAWGRLKILTARRGSSLVGINGFQCWRHALAEGHDLRHWLDTLLAALRTAGNDRMEIPA